MNEPDNPNASSYTAWEPANKAELSLALLRKTFAWARETEPVQPLAPGAEDRSLLLGIRARQEPDAHALGFVEASLRGRAPALVPRHPAPRREALHRQRSRPPEAHAGFVVSSLSRSIKEASDRFCRR